MAKVMVSIPDDLLRQVDEEASRRSTSRSALLAAAVRRELERRDPVALEAAVARSRERFGRSGAFEAGSVVRTDRDARP